MAEQRLSTIETLEAMYREQYADKHDPYGKPEFSLHHDHTGKVLKIKLPWTVWKQYDNVERFVLGLVRKAAELESHMGPDPYSLKIVLEKDAEMPVLRPDFKYEDPTPHYKTKDFDTFSSTWVERNETEKAGWTHLEFYYSGEEDKPVKEFKPLLDLPPKTDWVAENKEVSIIQYSGEPDGKPGVQVPGSDPSPAGPPADPASPGETAPGDHRPHDAQEPPGAS